MSEILTAISGNTEQIILHFDNISQDALSMILALLPIVASSLTVRLTRVKYLPLEHVLAMSTPAAIYGGAIGGWLLSLAAMGSILLASYTKVRFDKYSMYYLLAATGALSVAALLFLQPNGFFLLGENYLPLVVGAAATYLLVLMITDLLISRKRLGYLSLLYSGTTFLQWVALYVPLAALLTLSVTTVPLYSPLWSAMLAILLSASVRADLQHKKSERESVQKSAANLLAQLVLLLDRADPNTAHHSACVASYTRAIAEAIGLPAEAQSKAHAAALVHDIGKLAVPQDILRKAGTLTPQEFQAIKTHPAIGAALVAAIPGRTHELSRFIEQHHERLNGSGYPYGLINGQIDLISRIIAVADVYSALIIDRPYRSAMDIEKALEILEAEAQQGKLDPEIVKVFRSIIEARSPEFAAGKHTSIHAEAALLTKELADNIDLPSLSQD